MLNLSIFIYLQGFILAFVSNKFHQKKKQKLSVPNTAYIPDFEGSTPKKNGSKPQKCNGDSHEARKFQQWFVGAGLGNPLLRSGKSCSTWCRIAEQHHNDGFMNLCCSGSLHTEEFQEP